MCRFQRYFNRNFIVDCILQGGHRVNSWLGITAHIYQRAMPHEKRPERQHQHRCQRFKLRQKSRPPLNSKISQVYFSRPLRYYSLFILLILTLSVPFVAHTMYLNQTFLRNSVVLSFVGFSRFTFLHISVIGTLMRQYYKQRELITCTNRMLRLQLSISRIASQLGSNAGFIPPRLQYDRYTTLMLCFKLIPLLLSPTWTIFIVRIEHVLHRPVYLVALLILYYCHLALQLTLGNYFLNTLILTQQRKKVNMLLRTALQQAARHSVHSRPFNRRSRYQFHTLVYTIKRLRSVHETNSQISGSLSRLYGPQLVAFLGFVLTECTVQFFVLYFASCSRHATFPFKSAPPPSRLGEPCRIRWNPWAIVYIFGLLSDMCLVVSAAHQLQSRVQATRVVLAEGSARLPLLQAMCRHCSDAQLARTVSK